ncbi:hypothetical protein [Bacillus sp. MRMR6]|uniref:hypothetical protein n=1 Tax=Bacillus sp. MRMR6 TaxID=1928617 RepID=UPI000951AD68|nr:hypothetical protein [Bacillus sp. MRMR6]OLS39290.1 hypothetical protein BTR25_12875 [Bacillus sp. MRMR6]
MSIIFLAIIVAMVVFILRMLKSSQKRSIMYGNRVRWMLGGYILVLLISTGIAPLLQTTEATYKKVGKDQDFANEGFQIYEAAIEGEIERVDRKYISETWNFDYDGNQLDISHVDGEYISFQTVVERKATNDGKIEAIYYKAGSGMNDMDLTEVVNPIRMELSGDTLILMNPKITTLTFYQFEQPFTIKQFTGESWQGHHTHFIDGQSVLYLRIPKNLELIDKSQLYFQYVK